MFQFQVQIDVPKLCGTAKEWRSVSQSNKPPYEYATRAEAERMARICYPEHPTRIVEV